MFGMRNGGLYYKGVHRPLTYDKGRLKSVGGIADKILGKNRLRNLGLDVPKVKQQLDRTKS